MNIGKKRTLAEIQTADTTQRTDEGGVVAVWTTTWRPWIEIRPAGASAANYGMAAQSVVTTEIRLRFIEGVKPIHRVKVGSRIFSINGVANPDGRKRELVLFCVEVL